MNEKKKHRFWKWLTRPYQLVVYRDGNFEVLKKIRMNKLLFSLVIFAFLVIFFAIFSLLVVYTPIKYLVPGYPDRHTYELLYSNAVRVDSLAEELKARENYLNMIRDIILDEAPIDSDFAMPVASLTDEQMAEFNDLTQPRRIYEESDASVNVVSKKDIMPNLMKPVRGIVVNKFDKSMHHFGIDIARTDDNSVLAVLSGVVLEITYTIENGCTVVLQHEKGITSIYMNCESALVRKGQKLRQGEQIATYGDGENERLHFELWQNGNPLNPTEYIEF
ncbi:MAG: M23 family metallopeptidase [Bacteroidales bacterium]|nr:M23 family metallopeptidase [Bacteroidales bacterium]